MKITLKNIKDNPMTFMRSRGYAFDKRKGDELSFVKRISGRDFPRFHAYVSEQAPSSNKGKRQAPLPDKGGRGGIYQNLIINLHLDQKKPSYSSGNAHGGEYDGELVREEIRRLNN